MKYEATIFDLDGTLVHTMPEYRYKIVGQVLKDHNKKFSRYLIDRFWFEARRDEIVVENFGIDLEDFWRSYYNYDTTELRKQFTLPYSDADFVKELKEKDFKTGIVTGAPPHIASLEIGLIGKEYFDAIVVAQNCNGIKPKPNPHGIEECLRLLNIKKENAMYIGNADEDCMAAKNAGVFDVLLMRGEHSFPEINPSLTINSLYELRNLFNYHKL